jgi:hypothetical protein
MRGPAVFMRAKCRFALVLPELAHGRVRVRQQLGAVPFGSPSRQGRQPTGGYAFASSSANCSEDQWPESGISPRAPDGLFPLRMLPS